MIKTLFFVSQLVYSTANQITRYKILPDPHDTTSWNDYYTLTADVSYQAVFMHYYDVDYYKFTAYYLRSVALVVNSSSQEANIEIYKNSTANLVASYNSNISLTYNTFSNYLVSLAPSESIYIKVCATSDASSYSITVNTNPNLSGISIIKSQNGNKPTHYYGMQNHANQINYYMDYSCNTYAGYDIKTYWDAYFDAIYEWGNVGNNVVLNIVYNPSDADVILYARNSSYFPSNQITDYGIQVVSSWHLSGWTHEFNCTYASIINDYTIFGYYDDYYTYLNIVSTCIQIIGATIGLGYADKEKNYMMSPITDSTLNPFGVIGDGDVASYLDIYS